MSGTTRIVLASALLALGVGSATSLAGPPPGGGKTVTLTLAAPESPERPSSRIAKAFAAQATTLSKGTVVVKITYDAGKTSEGLSVGKHEANLIGLVRSGKAQLAIVPTRAFQAQGVTSFQALQAPFLVTTDAGMAKVTSGSVALRLQSGLGKVGLTGLGLAPEGLRRAFGFKKALISPADFAGIKIRSIPNKTTWDLLRALGATPVDISDQPYDDAVANGSVKGAESSMSIMATGGAPRIGFTAGNIALFPKIDALVGNADALADLTDDQRSTLQRAASAARAWAVKSLSEEAARNAYCKADGTVVTAPPSSIKALRAKVGPVLAELGRYRLTRDLMADIASQGGSASGLAPCSGGKNTANTGGDTVKTVIPKGVYRGPRVTKKDLIAAGASAHGARLNAGIVTLTTTADGYQRFQWDTDDPGAKSNCIKRKMLISGGMVVFELRGVNCGGDFSLVWKPAPGGIRFTRVYPNDPLLRVTFLRGVWKKIG